MIQKTICELAILFLLALASIRIFFISDPSSDPLASLPAIALAMTVLSFFAWGFTFQTIAVTFAVLFTFFTNFRALLRLNENLIVDHYSFLFIIGSAISLIMIGAAAFFIIITSPALPSLKKYEVIKTSKIYSGNLETGFYEPEKPTDKKTAYLYHYEKKDSQENASKKAVVIFIPNELATTFIYEPILVKMAHDGYSVYSADFYFNTGNNKILASKPMKRNTLLKMSISKDEQYDSWKKEEKSSYDAYLYKSLLSIVSPEEKDFVVLLGDSADKKLFLTLQKDDGRIDTCLDMSTVNGYDTKGYGPVEQTDPVIAYLLGKKKDSSMYVSNHTASELEKRIKQSMQITESK
ncbi:MAG: hypothetical protein K6G00_07700 [Treponema sp.]|nr:hypothetical protein [Treponema sp.]